MTARGFLSLILSCYWTFFISGAAAQEPKYDEPSSWDIEAEYEVKFDFRKNFALAGGNRDDLFLFEQEFQLRWSYRYNDWISFLLGGKLLGEHQLYTGGGGRRSDFDPERGESWFASTNSLDAILALRSAGKTLKSRGGGGGMMTSTPSACAIDATYGRSNSEPVRSSPENRCAKILAIPKMKTSSACSRASTGAISRITVSIFFSSTKTIHPRRHRSAR